MLAAYCLLLVAASEPSDALEEYMLPNGLRVVLERQATFPTIAVHVMYGVGMADDPAAMPGLVHLVEHLACDRTEHVSHGDLMSQLAWRGATLVNAMTSVDTTSFVETVPATELDAALWVESDRMGFLAGAITSSSLEHERVIVAQERAHRDMFQPDLDTVPRLWDRLFQGTHPYASAFKTNVTQVSKADVTSMIERHYGPQNAVLVLVGDLPADVRQRVAKYFGDLAPRGARNVHPPQPTLVVRVNDFARAVDSRFTMAWTAPPRGSRGEEVARVTAYLIDSLRRPATSDVVFRAQVLPYEVTSIFWLEASARAELRGDQLRDALLAEVQRLHMSVDERAVAQAARGVRIATLTRLQRFEDRAHDHALAAMSSRTVRNRVPSATAGDAVTVAEVRDYLAALLAAPVSVQ